MAKRGKEVLTPEEKRPLSKANLRKLSLLFAFMRPYIGPFILGLFALVFSTLTLLAFPRLAGELLNVAMGNTQYFDTIYQVTIALMVILFFQAVFGFIRVYTFALVSEKGMADLRKAVYKKFIWLPMGFYDNRRVGELMSRITSDVSTLQDTFSFTLAELLRQILTLIIGTGILFYFTPRLTLFMLLTFPVLVVTALIFGKFIRRLSKTTQDKLAATNVVVEESLQSISIVKAFTNEWLELKRYSKAVDDVVRVTIYASKYRGLFISFIIFAITGGIVAVGTYGALLIQSGDLDSGELFSFVLYTAFIGFSIAGLGDIFAQIQRSIGASERVLEILNEPDEIQENLPTIKLRGEISFENISFSYDSRSDFQVLKDLNFKINAGEKIALIGQSGSGKSTIINLLMRFYPLVTGQISVDGKNIKEYNLSSYRANLGIVPQEVILFGGTILENIGYGKPGASEDEIREAARKANALEFIEKFPEKFDTIVGERGVKLSGGQRQRVAIARAILKDPAILILDEATSSLDVQSEVLVQGALEKLMEGRTTIVIAHRLSTIKKVDRIFVIQEGRLAEMGSHAELTKMNNGIYTNLLKLQLQ
jgi:ATP-binding cassette, subfamily B, bacterial